VIALPALYLRHSMCVRSLRGGGFDRVSSLDPVAAARGWAHEGFRRLHLVDVDAEASAGSNAGLVDAVLRDGALDVQVAAGVQSAEQVQQLFDAGANRVVVGPRAFDEPEWLANLTELFPDVVVVATDVRERRVDTRGWVRTLPLDILDVVAELDGLRLGGLLLRQTGTDASLNSISLGLFEDVVEASGWPVIVELGAAAIGDLRALEHRGVSAVIVDLHGDTLDPRSLVGEFAG
jgi:phosphoribosylformimino-5-aminoimidazole carboxamide ribotide isomerase